MKIGLLYNENAGDGLSLTDLRHALEQHGHEVVHAVEKDAEFDRALEDSIDVVVAAGGDGTVWRAAAALIGEPVPLAILPMGTANNIATSLGIEGKLHDVIDTWATADRRPFDAGVIEWCGIENCFVEGLGAGLIPAAITANQLKSRSRKNAKNGKSSSKKTSATTEKTVLRRYLDVLDHLTPARCTIMLDDDERIEGAFLLLEVLNIRSIGASLVFSPDADPSDGLFDLVMATESQRPQLTDYLKQRIAGRTPRLDLPMRRAQRIDIDGVREMHVDDDVRQSKTGGLATIRMKRAALHVLVPAERESRSYHAPA